MRESVSLCRCSLFGVFVTLNGMAHLDCLREVIAILFLVRCKLKLSGTVWLQSELVSKKANWQPKGSLNLCRAQLSGDKVGGLVME